MKQTNIDINKMASFITSILLFAVIALFQQNAAAKDRVVLNDTGTITDRHNVQLEWDNIVPGKGASHQGEIKFKVNLRVDTSKINNQDGKILLKLKNIFPFEVNWKVTGGAQIKDSNAIDNEILVFGGKSIGNEFIDTFVISMKMDGRSLVSSQQLVFLVEWEPK
jgi:hypothetical protein